MKAVVEKNLQAARDVVRNMAEAAKEKARLEAEREAERAALEARKVKIAAAMAKACDANDFDKMEKHEEQLEELKVSLERIGSLSMDPQQEARDKEEEQRIRKKLEKERAERQEKRRQAKSEDELLRKRAEDERLRSKEDKIRRQMEEEETLVTQQTGPAKEAQRGKELCDVFNTHDWGNSLVSDGIELNNHDRVARINKALQEDHDLVTWFDGERMKGQIRNKMIDGIDKSVVVCAFVTKNYMEKINTVDENDNCEFEFNYARGEKPATLICVPMESRMQSPNDWKGILKATLGKKLYQANFAFDFDTNPERFKEEVSKLAAQIKDLVSEHGKA